MRRFLVLVFALALAVPIFAADNSKREKETCVSIDLSKLAGYYTASDGSFVMLEFMPVNYRLGKGQSNASMENLKSDVHLAVPGGKIPQGKMLVATTLCGGTKDCSSKSCQSSKDSCVEGMRGCFCQSK